jgi:hypothetical protein
MWEALWAVLAGERLIGSLSTYIAHFAVEAAKEGKKLEMNVETAKVAKAS